ncbi:MAG: hypothetical protein M3O36_02280, partial [Myxococcota bacterium]|nr:hypothetical protein [Myxococcota bacterium]
MKVMGRFDELFYAPLRGQFERCLAEYIAPRRWFRSKTRVVAGLSLDEVIPLPMSVEAALLVLHVRYTEGPPEDYVLPLTWVGGEAGEQLVRSRPHLLVGAVTVGDEARPRWIV